MANPFETEVSQAAKHLGIHYQKLVVGTMQTGSRFTLKAPYDSFLIHQGQHVALELKCSELHGSFPLDRVADHQLEGLWSAHQAGSPGWLLVNMRRKQAGGKTTVENVAWGLPIQDWDRLVQSLPPGPGGKPRKSIPYGSFGESTLFRPIARIHVESAVTGKKTLVWDLRVLLPD